MLHSKTYPYFWALSRDMKSRLRVFRTQSTEFKTVPDASFDGFLNPEEPNPFQRQPKPMTRIQRTGLAATWSRMPMVLSEARPRQSSVATWKLPKEQRRNQQHLRRTPKPHGRPCATNFVIMEPITHSERRCVKLMIAESPTESHGEKFMWK